MENLNLLADEMLVRRYVEGQDEAFDALLSRYKDRLYSYIVHQLHDREKANDIFQDTFVKVIMTLRSGRYTENGKFYAWLQRIAHNLVIDHYRSVETESTISDDETDGRLLENVAVATESREDEFITTQTLKEVRDMMNHLPEAQRQVVFMRFYQNLSFKEIADETGVSINTALGRMRYALLGMRRMAGAAAV